MRFAKKQTTRSKYGNKRTKVGDAVFASRKEARYYNFLLVLQDQGKIHSLRCQVPFTFMINGEAMRNPDTNRVIKYVADFEYFTSEGERKIVDVKGFKTDIYKIKKALMLACNGILIEEV